ncbi:MAG: PIN domain-containing protein [Nanoarchaeota archaeon]
MKDFPKNVKTVLIDTNAWMAIGELKIDLFSELEKCCDFPVQIATLEGTLRELQKIQEEQRGKFKRFAKLALDLIKAKKVEVFPHSTGNVDELLVDYSHGGFLVLTSDAALKKKLQRPYLTIRQGKMIVMIR